MSEAQSSKDAERELESFRRQWQEEVRRGKGQNKSQSAGVSSSRQAVGNASQKSTKLKPPTVGSSSAPVRDDDHDDQGFHDLENKDDALKLGGSSEARKNVTAPAEPKTALDHYEKAVERETAGSLGDSVSLYRKAFRVCNAFIVICYHVIFVADIIKA